LIKECRVSEFGQIGSVNNHNFYYAIYCLVSNYDEKVTCQSREASRYYGNRGLVIFSAQESVDKVEILAIRLQDYNGSLVSYSKPQLIENQNRKLLYIPVPMDGTGNFNLSEYYLWNSKSNQWGKLETESWMKKLVMPNKDVSPWKGIWVDLETMTSKIYLYKQGDGNCCPTGGLLTVRLSITDNHFSVVSTEYDKNQK
jgi:hypothetical protein